MNQKLAGKRILIVEDEYFIASDLQRALSAEGAEVVGPVGDLTRGLDLARADQLDAAVLDVHLHGIMSFPIAERLTADNVPYMFLTGYDAWSIPAAHDEIPRITKPFSTASVVDTLIRLCATGRGALH